jgi:hypothetical protein
MLIRVGFDHEPRQEEVDALLQRDSISPTSLEDII